MVELSNFQKTCQRPYQIAVKNFVDVALAIFVPHPFETPYQDIWRTLYMAGGFLILMSLISFAAQILQKKKKVSEKLDCDIKK